MNESVDTNLPFFFDSKIDSSHAIAGRYRVGPGALGNPPLRCNPSVCLPEARPTDEMSREALVD